MMKKNKRFLFIILIFFLALFLRIYKISELTDFLGDQGREGIVIYNWLQNGQIPILGPPVSTGQYLGPFFYYLIAPSYILFNFTPIAPAVFMAIVSSTSVFLIFFLLKRIFNQWAWYLTTLLYATSPLMISQERILWNPTPIPFFVFIFFFASYKIIMEKNVKWLVFSSLTVSILIQLHYSNLIFIPFCTAVWIYFLIKNRKSKQKVKSILWIFLSLAIFIAILFPFFYYEATHQFANTFSIMEDYVFAKYIGQNEQSLTVTFINVFARSFQAVIAVRSKFLLVIFGLIILVLPFLKKNFWHKIFAVYFIIAVLFVSLSVNNPPDHYLRFIYPIAFLLTASFVFVLTKYFNKKVAAIMVFALLFNNLLQIDIFKPGNNDIQKTKLITEEIVNTAGSKLFSFTLISSRSFSDLHYRYFFTINNVKPEKIENDSYSLLFLVCENGKCPTREEMENRTSFQTLCYDHLCDKKYPEVSLANWRLTKTKDVNSARIFIYEKP